MPQCRLKTLNLPSLLTEPFLISALHDRDKIAREVHKYKTDIETLLSSYTYSIKSVFEERGKKQGENAILEIACGRGDFLTRYAKQYPNDSFIGIDYAYPVLERAILKAQSEHLNNILFYSGRAEDFLEYDFSGETFSRIFINFPDPWPKKRHIKRRIIQPEIVSQLAKALKPGGLFISATDVEDLHLYHTEILHACEEFHKEKEVPSGIKDLYQIPSVYQQKGYEKEHSLFLGVYQKV